MEQIAPASRSESSNLTSVWYVEYSGSFMATVGFMVVPLQRRLVSSRRVSRRVVGMLVVIFAVILFIVMVVVLIVARLVAYEVQGRPDL